MYTMGPSAQQQTATIRLRLSVPIASAVSDLRAATEEFVDAPLGRINVFVPCSLIGIGKHAVLQYPGRATVWVPSRAQTTSLPSESPCLYALVSVDCVICFVPRTPFGFHWQSL